MIKLYESFEFYYTLEPFKDLQLTERSTAPIMIYVFLSATHVPSN